MQALILNSGSSSIKFSLFVLCCDEPFAKADVGANCLIDGELTAIGSQDAAVHISSTGEPAVSNAVQVEALTFEQATRAVLNAVEENNIEPDAVGYRVVHPGPHLHGHQRITPELLELLEKAQDFAPLHDPETLLLIRKTMQRFPDVPHYACFDTVFHETMGVEATTYPLPLIYRAAGVRRYGFHGLSCESIVRQLRLKGNLPKRLVIAHLGSGCSVTALVDGASIDTTMGLTPTGGVLMGTRSGDLDPGLVLYLLRQHEGDKAEAIAAVESLLNHSSGIVSLSELPNDVKAVREAAKRGDINASLSLKVFTRSISRAIGGFSWILGGLDAIVFTGGIGEHDSETRQEILSGVGDVGVDLDPARNYESGRSLRTISSGVSNIEVLTAPALEGKIIAMHVETMYCSDKKLNH